MAVMWWRLRADVAGLNRRVGVGAVVRLRQHGDGRAPERERHRHAVRPPRYDARAHVAEATEAMHREQLVGSQWLTHRRRHRRRLGEADRVEPAGRLLGPGAADGVLPRRVARQRAGTSRTSSRTRPSLQSASSQPRSSGSQLAGRLRVTDASRAAPQDISLSLSSASPTVLIDAATNKTCVSCTRLAVHVE